jgi:hypothetical protein
MKMPRPPRRHPRNPFELPDVEAQGAICSAFVSCDYLNIKASEFTVSRRAAKRLQLQIEGMTADAAEERIRCAFIALRRYGAIEVPSDVTRACTFYGDSLHPKVREYLGLHPLYRLDDDAQAFPPRQSEDA